jgi:hypothetical protein
MKFMVFKCLGNIFFLKIWCGLIHVSCLLMCRQEARRVKELQVSVSKLTCAIHGWYFLLELCEHHSCLCHLLMWFCSCSWSFGLFGETIENKNCLACKNKKTPWNSQFIVFFKFQTLSKFTHLWSLVSHFFLASWLYNCFHHLFIWYCFYS